MSGLSKILPEFTRLNQTRFNALKTALTEASSMFVSTPSPPAGSSIGQLDLDIGDGRGGFAGAQGMFDVAGNLELWNAEGSEAMNERGQWTVALAGKFDGLAVAQQGGVAFDAAILAAGLKALQLPGRISFDVLAPRTFVSAHRRRLRGPRRSTSSLAMGPNSRCMSLGRSMPNSLSRR